MSKRINFTKPLLALILFFAASGSCIAQSDKEQQFKKTVQKIITAFSRQDSVAVAKFIHPKMGVYHLYRPGVLDFYIFHQTISFSDSSAYPASLYRFVKGIHSYPLQYAKLPVFSCNNEKWSKRGLFTDTTRTDHLLSNTCKALNKYESEIIVPAKTISFFYTLENKSRRVVLADTADSNDLVFYLTYRDKQWWLVIFDDVSSDCSV